MKAKTARSPCDWCGGDHPNGISEAEIQAGHPFLQRLKGHNMRPGWHIKRDGEAVPVPEGYEVPPCGLDTQRQGDEMEHVTAPKPPIGVEPRWHWIEKNPSPTRLDCTLRLAELQGAVERYKAAENFYPHKKWLEEISDFRLSGI